MNFRSDKQEKYTLFRLEDGKLDATIASEVKAHFVKVSADGERNMIFDMSNIKYCDSSGLSAILVGNRLCHEKDGIFVLCGISDHVFKLIRISQLDTVLNILPKVEEAVDAVFMHDIENELKSEGSVE